MWNNTHDLSIKFLDTTVSHLVFVIAHIDSIITVLADKIRSTAFLWLLYLSNVIDFDSFCQAALSHQLMHHGLKLPIVFMCYTASVVIT